MPGAGQVKPCYNAEPQQNATEELIRKFIDSAENKRQDKSSGRDKQESDTGLARRITHGFAE